MLAFTLATISKDGNQSILHLKRRKGSVWENTDLRLCFSGFSKQNEIISHAIFQQAPHVESSSDAEGAMSLFIIPPHQEPELAVAKDVVFLLDISGSMGFSKVMDTAKDALAQGVS